MADSMCRCEHFAGESYTLFTYIFGTHVHAPSLFIVNIAILKNLANECLQAKSSIAEDERLRKPDCFQ